MFYWSESHRAFPEARRWRKRFHPLTENDRVTLHKSNVVGWEMSLQRSLESTIYHIGRMIIPGQKLVSSLIRRRWEGCKRRACVDLAFEVIVGNTKLTLVGMS